ncbi:hypothetical protein B0H13DRAFT_1853823 [Mycena leptocephala]|nr:hypothetical protein B0H13DRAFT_1853823 [Mycena leptocephala]
MSMQISGISVTALGTIKTKNLVVNVSVDGRTIKKERFEKKGSSGPCNLEFYPPYSVEDVLRLELVKDSYLSLKHPTVLAATTFTVQDAKRILHDHNVVALAASMCILTQLTDYRLSNGMAEFNLSFSMKPNPGQDSILAGSLVAKDLKSVLEHLGTSYTVFEAFVAASLGLQLFPKTLRQTFYFASAENFDGC